jgi:hypothetical protein
VLRATRIVASHASRTKTGVRNSSINRLVCGFDSGHAFGDSTTCRHAQRAGRFHTSIATTVCLATELFHFHTGKIEKQHSIVNLVFIRPKKGTDQFHPINTAPSSRMNPTPPAAPPRPPPPISGLRGIRNGTRVEPPPGDAPLRGGTGTVPGDEDRRRRQAALGAQRQLHHLGEPAAVLRRRLAQYVSFSSRSFSSPFG